MIHPSSFILHPFLLVLLVVALTALGGFAGRAAGPAMARLNYIVTMDEHVRHAGANLAAAADDQYVKAFRATGLPARQIADQADEIRAKFRRGAMWFGLWCGLVAGLYVAGALGWRRRREYETDPMDCVACGRCWLTCPVERRRVRRAGPPAGEPS